MEIVSFSNNLLKQRSVLLQKSLRPNCNSYPIESEYPIVLSEKNPQFSYCVTKSDQELSAPRLIAHANLWPRIIAEKTTQFEYPIALVGNVATEPSHRGRGVMSSLFSELWNKALQLGCHGLILWSDLLEFYRKLGFFPCGKEYRICFSRKKLMNFSFDIDYRVPSNESLSFETLNEMMRLRLSCGGTIKRSPYEFKDLLKIPDTVVVASYHREELQSYFILGKGNDMVAVVHEWGARSPDIVIGAMKFIVEATNWDMIWLLSPTNLSPQWVSAFNPYIKSFETHPLALARFKADSPVSELMQESFIWGLDSI